MRMRWCVVVAIVGVWWWWPSRAPHAPHSRPAPQAAVMFDGFAAGDGMGRRIVTYDAEGRRRAQLSVNLPDDTRVVGLSIGVGVIYRDGKQIVAAGIDDRGEVVQPERFGKSVQKMCAQTASNEHRFGVAWTEADGAVWFVYGPTSPAAQRATPEEPEAADEPPRQPSYCGIAAAGEKTALLWRDGERSFLLRCGKRCDGLPTRAAIDARRTVVGFGCTRDACVVVTRGVDASVAVSWVKSNGKLAWTRPLPDASADTEVSIAGLRDTVAVAYATGTDRSVVEVAQDGTVTSLWRDSADPDTAPSVVWSSGKLLVVYQREGELATAMIRR